MPSLHAFFNGVQVVIAMNMGLTSCHLFARKDSSDAPPWYLRVPFNLGKISREHLWILPLPAFGLCSRGVGQNFAPKASCPKSL